LPTHGLDESTCVATACFRAKIDRILDRVLVRGPGAERPVRREAEEVPVVVFGTDDREARRGLGREPGLHRRRRPRDLVVDGRAVLDDLVEIADDGSSVLREGAVDELHTALNRERTTAPAECNLVPLRGIVDVSAR